MKGIIFSILYIMCNGHALAESKIPDQPLWFKYASDAYVNTDATVLFTLEKITALPSEDDMPGWTTVKKTGEIKKHFSSIRPLDKGTFEFITAIETDPKFDETRLPNDYIVNLCFNGDHWTDGGFGTFNQASPEFIVAIEKIREQVEIKSLDKRPWCQ